MLFTNHIVILQMVSLLLIGVASYAKAASVIDTFEVVGGK